MFPVIDLIIAFLRCEGVKVYKLMVSTLRFSFKLKMKNLNFIMPIKRMEKEGIFNKSVWL